MPGLVGMVGLNGRKIDRNLIVAQRDAIRHCTWYRVDDFVNSRETVAVSRVHLGIINNAPQPFAGRNGCVQIFLQGELYNDQSAVARPLELIYQLYEKYGRDFVLWLKGSFVVVIIDEDKDTVLVANDRLASRPVFYFNDGQVIYFSPEMKALLASPRVRRKLNQAALADFMANGQFTREHTLIEGVETIDKATVLEITSTGVTRRQYWDFEINEDSRDQGPVYYQEKLDALMRQSVKRCLFSDSPYGVLLSGGYDSRGILGYYLEAQTKQPLRTISWGRDEDIPQADCVIAKKLAHQLNARHQFYHLSAEEVVNNFREFVFLGEGLTWFPESYEVFHQIRSQQGVDIVLRGDEVFGCLKIWVHDEHTMFRGLSLRSLRLIPSYRRILRQPYYHLLSEHDDATSRLVSTRCHAKNIYHRKHFFLLDIYQKYYLNPLNYVKTFAMESLNPWLDYDILDFVSDLPLKYKLDKSLYIKTVTKMFPDLFKETARRDNIIDWRASFKNSPELQRFIYRELVEQPDMLGEFVDPAALKNELDTFFMAPVSSSPRAKPKVVGGAMHLLQRFPQVYNLAHKYSYYTRKRRGAYQNTLPTTELILRLLILKTWMDVFLN